MVEVTCTNKIKDKNNRVKAYELENRAGIRLQFTSEQLKHAIFLEQLFVNNLKLTTDGKLVGTVENTPSKVISTPTNESSAVQEEVIRKIDILDYEQYNTLDINKIISFMEEYLGDKLESVSMIDTGSTNIQLRSMGQYPVLIANKVPSEEGSKACNTTSSEDKRLRIYIPSIKNSLLICDTQQDFINALQTLDNLPLDSEYTFKELVYGVYETVLKRITTRFTTVQHTLLLDLHLDKDELQDLLINNKGNLQLYFDLIYSEPVKYVLKNRSNNSRARKGTQVVESKILSISAVLLDDAYSFKIENYIIEDNTNYAKVHNMKCDDGYISNDVISDLQVWDETDKFDKHYYVLDKEFTWKYVKQHNLKTAYYYCMIPWLKTSTNTVEKLKLRTTDNLNNFIKRELKLIVESLSVTTYKQTIDQFKILKNRLTDWNNNLND